MNANLDTMKPDSEIKVTTYWQPKGQNYFVEDQTTLAQGRKYNCDWVKSVEAGATFLTLDYSYAQNPGKLIVIANIL